MTTDKESVKIGRRIAYVREQRGLTQSEFARLLKTSQSAIARIEKGEQNLSTKTLSRIENVLEKDIISLSPEAMNFQIEGGKKLKGKIAVRTSKNAAVVLLCAALLNRGTTVLKRMPRIEEVNRIIEVLQSVGVAVRWLRDDDIEIIPPARLALNKLDRPAAVKTRSILLFLGPLIHLAKEFVLPHPGGCKIGKRTVRPHLFALEKLGVNIRTVHDEYRVSTSRLKPAEIILYESGDTATENALMTAAKIPGTTIIKYASANYQVQDLCFFLKQCGVQISGIGTTTLTVTGIEDINLPITYAPSEDPIEAMLFLSVAATTNSSITIEKCPIDFLELELLKLEKMGFRCEVSARYKAENGETNLVDITTFSSRLTALGEKIYGRPYPGLNIDNLPFFVPIATQARGQTFIHDWIYEDRAIYYMELTKLGANMILADPYRVYINGPTKLRPAEVVCPPALRPAAIILIAMLAAPGKSILRNIYSINRGYENLALRLRSIGARIRILRDL